MVVENKAIGADTSEEMVQRGLSTFSGMYELALEQWYLRVNRREDGKVRDGRLQDRARKALSKVSATVKGAVKPGMSVKKCWRLWKTAILGVFGDPYFESLFDKKLGEFRRAEGRLDAYFKADVDGTSEDTMRDVDRLRRLIESASTESLDSDTLSQLVDMDIEAADGDPSDYDGDFGKIRKKKC